jgi:hypothetical protein
LCIDELWGKKLFGVLNLVRKHSSSKKRTAVNERMLKVDKQKILQYLLAFVEDKMKSVSPKLFIDILLLYNHTADCLASCLLVIHSEACSYAEIKKLLKKDLKKSMFSHFFRVFAIIIDFSYKAELDWHAIAKLATEKGKDVKIRIPKELHRAFDFLFKLQEQDNYPTTNEQYVFSSWMPDKLREFRPFYEKAVNKSGAASSPTVPEIAPGKQIKVCTPDSTVVRQTVVYMCKNQLIL